MDLKLQQAIVATRAGRTDVAQSLLTQLINEKPDEANAWFLLGQLVESKDRQVRYLQKAIELDPDNPVAKRQVAQLTAPTIPAPVIARDEAENIAFSNAKEGTAISAAAAAAVSHTTATVEPPGQQTPPELHDNQLTLETNTVVSKSKPEEKGDEWQDSAIVPKRESKGSAQKARVLHIPQDPSQSISASDRTPEEVWLLRILAVMVIAAVIVLAFLVLLIVF